MSEHDELPVCEAQYRRTRECFYALLEAARAIDFPEQYLRYNHSEPMELMGIDHECVLHRAFEKLEDIRRVTLGPTLRGLLIPDILSCTVTLVYVSPGNEIHCIGLADGYHLADNVATTPNVDVVSGSIRHFPSLCDFLASLAQMHVHTA